MKERGYVEGLGVSCRGADPLLVAEHGLDHLAATDGKDREERVAQTVGTLVTSLQPDTRILCDSALLKLDLVFAVDGPLLTRLVPTGHHGRV